MCGRGAERCGRGLGAGCAGLLLPLLTNAPRSSPPPHERSWASSGRSRRTRCCSSRPWRAPPPWSTAPPAPAASPPSSPSSRACSRCRARCPTRRCGATGACARAPSGLLGPPAHRRCLAVGWLAGWPLLPSAPAPPHLPTLTFAPAPPLPALLRPRSWNAAVGLRGTLAKLVNVLRKEAKASGRGGPGDCPSGCPGLRLTARVPGGCCPCRCLLPACRHAAAVQLLLTSNLPLRAALVRAGGDRGVAAPAHERGGQAPGAAHARGGSEPAGRAGPGGV